MAESVPPVSPDVSMPQIGDRCNAHINRNSTVKQNFNKAAFKEILRLQPEINFQSKVQCINLVSILLRLKVEILFVKTLA